MFIRKSLQDELQIPIQGWFSNEQQFAMGPFYEKAKGIRGFQIASPSIIGIRGVEVAFEMIEITCDEMNSLAKAFEMISDLCKELNGEEVEREEESEEELPAGANLH
jgi:kynureninase